ncbi:CocE/NonD family hydrolase C-terminal non-catalytic domain-containing protein [Streptomyces swartbergensis]|uniref:CocE/NonD family hydrolase C-terminal non-catalytic domain-containing protein n=1 Tax=Streptomyces swartbergensis TaxID=487165 RepID=UPI001ABF81F2|nr:CocE/NonD family hydrolase C-terminal non-catalytic domain-containing protein [Streptomyces swartbergensis]
MEFGLAHARGEEPPHRAPVRLYVMGEDTWRDFESWPPSGYSARRFHLGAHGALSADQPEESAPDHYRYDPADPTPAVGGVRLVKDCGVSTTAPWRPAPMSWKSRANPLVVAAPPIAFCTAL